MDKLLQQRWDARYAKTNNQPQACRVLRDFSHLLPVEGQALDLACGMGGNALLLAQAGLSTTAWDLSPVGLEKLAKQAERQALAITIQHRDVLEKPPLPDSFDVIVVSYFLERDVFPALVDALKPSGLLFYETFVADKPVAIGPSNPDYLLLENELLRVCESMVIRAYREEGQLGDSYQSVRHVAMVVAQKPVQV